MFEGVSESTNFRTGCLRDDDGHDWQVSISSNLYMCNFWILNHSFKTWIFSTIPNILMIPLEWKLNKSFLHKTFYTILSTELFFHQVPKPFYWAFRIFSNCTYDFKCVNRSPESLLLTMYLFCVWKASSWSDSIS